MTDAQPNLDSWDDFSGVYLKADEVKDYPLKIVPTNIEAEFQDGKPKVSIEFQYKNRQRKMGMNSTNLDIVKKSGLMPRQIIGKTLVFEKTKVRNPTSNTIVDSFILDKIE